jgi:signal transduction histidine kinase
MDEILMRDILRSAEFGSLLSRSLEKLMLGTLDLDAETIDLSLSKLIAKSERCCIPVHVFYQDEGLQDAQVRCNPIFATLIFENIASNARYAMRERDIDHGIVLYIHREGDALHLEFTDKGIGMEHPVMEALNSGVPVSSRKGPGHGLGFQYCRELAQKMGARLFVKGSVPDVGTTVCLELRLSPP